MAQEVLGEEVTEHLGVGQYERRPEEGEHRGYRDGHRETSTDTGEGRVPFKVRQVRESPEP